MTPKQRYEGGPTLCQKHAYQVNRLGIEGDCDPVSWRGGHGQIVKCDVVADPGLVQNYVDASARFRRSKTAKSMLRRWSQFDGETP